MIVKLFNFSALPTKELRALLHYAARQAGCEGPVVTKVNRGGSRCHGEANKAWCVYEWYTSRKPRDRYGELKYDRSTQTNGGFVTLWPFTVNGWRKPADPLACAESLFKLAVHEYQHVADFQQGKPMEHRKRWANRCQEKRANTTATFAALRPDKKRDELILNLAVAIEQSRTA